MIRSWCVIFRTGGRENFTWHRSALFMQLPEATACMESVRKMGYKAYVEDFEKSLTIGLPEVYLPLAYTAMQGGIGYIDRIPEGVKP